MKNKLTTLIATVLAALLLTACVVQPVAAPASDDATADSTAADNGEEIATRIVTDDLGREVEIPANPQKVVFADEEHASMVTSLGYVPYAMAWSYQEDFVSTLEGIGGNVADLSPIISVGERNQPNVEKILTLEPDLIVWVDWAEEEILSQLEEIAPTLAMNPRHDVGGGYDIGPGGPRYSKQRIYASIVGLEGKLDAQIAEYESLLADVKERHGDLLPNLEWTFLDTGADFIPHMYDLELFATFAYNAVMTDLGMTPLQAMVDATEEGFGFEENFGYAQISLEVVPDFAADVLFIGRYDDLPLDDQLLTVLSNTLPAQNDQIYQVDSNVWTYHLVQAEIEILRQVDEILNGGVENLGDFE
ncbi:MAG: ABC transporter substrate-binding protein [Chloroflexota bacterium]